MRVRNIEKLGEDIYNIFSPHCDCGATASVGVSGQQLFAYHQGYGVEVVIPQQPPEVREQFISGVCPTCWVELFEVVEV